MDKTVIIVDEHTETLLIKYLDELRAKKGPMHALHLKLSAFLPRPCALHTPVVDAIGAHLPGADIRIYICADGDVFALVPTIKHGDIPALLTTISTALGREVKSEHATLFNLDETLAKLRQEVEGKLKGYDNARKQQELEEQEKRRISVLQFDAGAGASARIHKTRRERKDMEILIIEDDNFMRKLVEAALSNHYHTTGLSGVQEVLQTYITLAPNIVFLDINLPDVSGHELLEKIIALDADAYVVMLSGNSDLENIQKAMAGGAKGFVAKPFTQKKLFEYIERYPQNRQSA